jgi:hypothetical protein
MFQDLLLFMNLNSCLFLIKPSRGTSQQDKREMKCLCSEAVQACESIRMDEKQSLLVKFSALCPVVKNTLRKVKVRRCLQQQEENMLSKQSAEALILLQ